MNFSLPRAVNFDLSEQYQESTVDKWDKKRKDLNNRLRRIEGQIRGIQRQLENGEECEAVAAQMSAARKAMDKAFFTMMSCAVSQELEKHTVMTEDMESGVEDITRILAKYA
ncbi:MAG: metal-sensing transcriptional repressor [Gammaproteobacteria bacterium]|jgi:DNA-binding FrmR family transcriptional regulator|nr:metal-sensing transcriptional repressor [Gammaproteobacteria bacterium]MBU1833818.1 metal-sensing transcriptional repressor [Gammaproteobacteria bacterium]